VRAELEKLWRDAKLCQIYEGTNQLNRLEVYRGLCHRETISSLPPLRRIQLNGAAGAQTDARAHISVNGDGGES
jgi:hypothetical protein